MDVKRCICILENIKDKLLSIETELHSNHQEGGYLLEKMESVLWDANVLNAQFDLLQKKQNEERSAK